MQTLSRWLCAIFAIGFLSVCGRAQVRVWQGTLRLPVYEEGPPDPNPPFDQFATNRFNYPYTLRTNLTDRRTDHALRAIFLENEYLKCSVLPDLGGHLYTCIDKINGKPMFYANPSIKKANIGYRGAWAAFGVEYNFPVSHNWMSLSPIDFAFRQNPDGSASVTVGNIDRVYGMQWSVEMRLRPRSTVLEQQVFLYNRDDVRHRFYWWNNAGVEVWDDSHVEYPMRFAASHGFTEVQPWPVDAGGKDLSVIRNQTDGPVSLFVHGSREPFMGVWNPHTNSGTVHFAQYDELPAKKTWSWGADADGLDWRRALSDNNSAYVEVQAGLFRNQETYAFLEPRQTIHFSEYWMPVRDIGGITRANLAGVLHVAREGGNLEVGFNSNGPIPDAQISVLKGNDRIFHTKIALVPEQAWSQKLRLPDIAEKYTVEIRDHSGLLLRQKEDEYDWTPASEVHVGPQERHQIPLPDRRSEDDWLQLGKEQELNGKLLLALDTYGELLQKFPESFSGLKAAGRLAASLLHYEEATRFLQRVQSRNTTDFEASYYLGIAYDGSALIDKARECFEIAYRSPEWHGAAALRLGELSARSQHLEQAEEYLSEALRSAPNDVRAAEELVAIRSALGEESQARTLAQQYLDRFPVSYFLHEELGTSDAQHLADDDSRILKIAATYMRLGLYDRALSVLSRSYPGPRPDQSEPGAPAPNRDPMIAYYRAYCRNKLGGVTEPGYEIADEPPLPYIFPSSATDLLVLESAVRELPNSANAHYLLGNLLFSRGFTNPALAEWQRASQLNSQIPVLDASVGLALLQVKNDPESALAAFRHGIESDKNNEAVYVGADQALSILEHPSRERVDVLEHYPNRADIPADLVFELALNLAEAGDLDRAVSLFRGHFFPRQEGGTNVRQVWVELQLERVVSLAKEHRCDEALSAASQLASPVAEVSFTQDGLDPFVKSARVQYALGKMDAGCGRAAESRTHFQAAAIKSGAAEVLWAWLAAKELPAFDQSQWDVRLQAALDQANGMIETSSFGGFWAYTAGMLNRTRGNESQAKSDFRHALLLPDRMLSYHLTREALATR